MTILATSINDTVKKGALKYWGGREPKDANVTRKQTLANGQTLYSLTYKNGGVENNAFGPTYLNVGDAVRVDKGRNGIVTIIGHAGTDGAGVVSATTNSILVVRV